MNKRFGFLFAAVLLATGLITTLSLIGCSGKPHGHGTAAQTEPLPPSPWDMAFTTEPAQPKYGQETVFRVSLQDDSGKPMPGAKVEADLKMKGHDMGKNIVSLIDNGQGIYEGKGKFTMAGPWDVVVIANKDGKGGAQTFNVVARKD
ncbi:MAG TPA: FixH family protein [Terriglobales bacterium]|nr:FixH family protein [Terriglobales bacterium]